MRSASGQVRCDDLTRGGIHREVKFAPSPVSRPIRRKPAEPKLVELLQAPRQGRVIRDRSSTSSIFARPRRKPSVCRSGRWKTIRIVKAVSIAMSAYLRWPPGLPLAGARYESSASSGINGVTSTVNFHLEPCTNARHFQSQILAEKVVATGLEPVTSTM
jgi:hypothetical protein